MMFHLLLMACLSEDPSTCRQVLLPEGDAATLAQCEGAATQIVPDWLARHPDLTGGKQHCVETAALPALTADEIAPGVFVHHGEPGQIEEANGGRIANLGFVVGETVAVIDAGASRAEGEALYAAIRAVTDRPISHLILTHMHPDHSLGAQVFAEVGAQIVGHPKLQASLEARAGNYLPNLNRILGTREMLGTVVAMPDGAPDTVDLGDRVLTLIPAETAHTDNDLMVHDPATDVLFTGDLVFRDLTPVVDGSLLGWLDWMGAPPDLNVSLIVPGHGPVAEDWETALAAQDAFLTALRDETRAAIDAGMPMSDAVPEITRALEPLAEGWNAFDVNTPRDATAAYKELEWE
ncbi:quinoprotein relay system zinc metallohydrolase 2 (plasmid) [Paracoccus sp. TK19116]|uniref:Quinoprotein relay system zinc metallohydrolase 2 n=1 Tax=Paracoccus albicereus TaxID=2922394 RepID=A0ABT1MM90_9RHOB|nr:quinoprotein relay system zinc metallohydrolase 2 [Paracoccus albicereus]MCQ0969296.1 quinoprotein relay system zinc metallohydrolase 2 [Paracoccus albicereus]